MQIFIRVAELASFTRAAYSLVIPKASASTAVQQLESSLGVCCCVGPLVDSTLVARPLGAFRIINCASPAYLERHGTPKTLDDLAHHQLIHYVSNLGARSPGWEYPDGSGYASLPMEGRITVNSTLVARPLGAFRIINCASPAYLERHGTPKPAWALHQLPIDAGQLAEVLPDLLAEPMPVTLLYANRRNLPRRVQAFMAWVTQVLQPHLEPMA
ncbi:MAG: hypothetical protein WDW36_010323 [Sanguina aurantia]